MKIMVKAAIPLILSMALPVFADEVVLKNGAVFPGVVREEGDKVIVEVDFGTMTFKRADVQTIRKGDDPLKEYDQRLKAAAGVKDYYPLALWARDKGLATRATDLFKKVIFLEPDHEGARKALGYEKVEDGWYEGDELMVAKGFVKHQGRWLKRETAEKLQEGDKLLQIEVERLQSTERIARLQAEVERARVAVERERIDLDRERGRFTWDGAPWFGVPWLSSRVVSAPAASGPGGCRAPQGNPPPAAGRCAECGSCPCACRTQPILRSSMQQSLPPLPTRLPPLPPWPAPITGRP